MKLDRELREMLKGMDRKPYPAYKSLKGEYRFKNYVLGIDHVQGDPFASPSHLHISLSGKETGIPKEYVKNEDRRVAFADCCLRNFGKAVSKYTFQAKGSGKSGLIEVSRPGQQVLRRTACEIKEDGSLIVRFCVGFPANGRTINSRELLKVFFEFLPAIVEESVIFANMNQKFIEESLFLYEDQHALYDLCKKHGWAAFVADGSILPRLSGVSDKPMKEAVPFFSPESMKEEVVLPHVGKITGMAIKEGITLIVGGGYHGKSTLLNALETGIYHHIKGDGREYIVANENAFKIRAEDGRAISGTDISMFIRDLPNKKDTTFFWTEDASGSTSQAANVAEALASGSKLLLMDEDTSATNFMVRDELMAQVIAKEKEPITPFLMRARALYEHAGVSTIIVAGSSGAYFYVADKVIQMDCYRALDITDKVRELCPLSLADEIGVDCNYIQKRKLGIKPLERKKGSLKVKQYSKETFSIGKENLELRGMEQLMDYEQTTTLGYLLKHVLERLEKDKKITLEEQMEKTWEIYEKRGMKGILGTEQLLISFAQIRKQDFYACVNRYRGFVN